MYLSIINSVVYKWKDNQFQEIGTVGAKGSTVFAINSETFIAFANQYDHSYRIDSTVFKWSGGRFVKIQDLQTTGAYNVKSFNINNDTFLALANFRSGEYCSDSLVSKEQSCSLSFIYCPPFCLLYRREA